jgi:hypothetical protein
VIFPSDWIVGVNTDCLLAKNQGCEYLALSPNLQEIGVFRISLDFFSPFIAGLIGEDTNPIPKTYVINDISPTRTAIDQIV